MQFRQKIGRFIQKVIVFRGLGIKSGGFSEIIGNKLFHQLELYLLQECTFSSKELRFDLA